MFFNVTLSFLFALNLFYTTFLLLKIERSVFVANTNYGYEYFPVNINQKLVYSSTLGDANLKVEKEDQLVIFKYEGKDFLYHQYFTINSRGIFISEVYQKIKLLLFITKESKVSYNEPLPRMEFPLYINKQWNWRGKEINNGDISDLEVEANLIGIEEIFTPAGTFETIKIKTVINTSDGTRNIVTEWFAKDVGLVKMTLYIEGGGLMGFLRDVLGYGEIKFELKQIKS